MEPKSLLIYKASRNLFLTFNILLLYFLPFPTYSETIKSEENIDMTIQKNIYFLGPGDVFELNIIDIPELSSQLEILPDGTVTLPLVGSVFIKNMSLDNAKDLIQEKLSEHLLIPEVQLKMINYRPLRITLIGEIQSPGLYLIKNQVGEFESKTITMVDAIQQAGGLTNRSDIKKVKVVRKYFENGNPQFKEASFNLWELINDGKQENNPILFDGDSIVIKKVENTTKESTEFAFANLTPKNIQVKVIGGVKIPGILELPPNTPLSQAVFSAGGPEEYVTQNKAQLIRLNKDGSVSNKKYKINKELPTSEKYNPLLKNYDIVYVAPNTFSRTTGALATVAKPLTNAVTILTLLRFISTY